MATQLEDEKVQQSILEHIVLGVAHEINNPNTFVRMNMVNLKKMINLLRPCFDEYTENHPDAKFGPYNLDDLRLKIGQLIESTLGATVRIITVADKLKQCTSVALSQGNSVDLVDVLKNILTMYQFLTDKWAKIDFIYDASKNHEYSGHQLQLEQGLSILLTNACDAISDPFGPQVETPPGKIAINLSDEGSSFKISFKDNGCGISDDIKQKIFAPYFTTKPQGVGDGMGLPLCQAVVERHGGKISFTSVKGEGSEFVVELPKNH